MPGHDNELTGAIAEQTSLLHQRHVADNAVAAIISGLVRELVNSIPGAHHACIAVVTPDGVDIQAATDATADALIRLERSVGAGPCLAAATHRRFGSGTPVDLSQPNKWPAFTQRALATTPIRSILPTHLFRTNTASAVLAVYGDTPTAFDTRAVATTAGYATIIAMPVHAAERDRQFHDALASRDILGQAKGVLMERFSVDADKAFEILRQMSQETNIKVTELARRLIATDHPPTTET